MSLLFSVTSFLAWLFYTKRLGNNLAWVDCPDSTWDNLKSKFKYFSACKPNVGKKNLALWVNCQGEISTRTPGFSAPFLNNVTLKLHICLDNNRTYLTGLLWGLSEIMHIKCLPQGLEHLMDDCGRCDYCGSCLWEHHLLACDLGQVT